ncbi:MAG: hypothetical protein ACREVL_13385 [Solimonas sp.]
MMSKPLLLVLALLVTAPAKAGEAESQALPPALRAISVAYLDYAAKLRKNESFDVESGHYYADINNHEMTVRVDGRKVIVGFGIRPYQGHSFRGGGAQYELDLDTGKIIGITYAR